MSFFIPSGVVCWSHGPNFLFGRHVVLLDDIVLNVRFSKACRRTPRTTKLAPFESWRTLFGERQNAFLKVAGLAARALLPRLEGKLFFEGIVPTAP